MTTTTHAVLTGHDPSVTLDGSEIPGVDFLLQEWTDERGRVTRELAVRPGHERRDITWGPPVSMTAEAL